MSESCLIIAGEKSGEEHAESFLPDLVKKSPKVQFFGVGGELFRNLGVEILFDLKDFSSMGVSEVLGKIPFYIQAENKLLTEVKKRNCKTAILIDFQGFNMRIAKKLKKMGVKVLYYVAPQAWAWKSGRAKTIQKCIHTLFTILPFEKKWFGERGVKLIKAVSHPLYNKYKNELKDSYKRNFEDIAKAPRLLLLPGSRNSEVSVLLPVFCQTVDKLRQAHPHLEVAIVKSGSVKESYYQLYENYFDKSYLSDELAQALNWSDLAMAASGTVTLACALFQVPTIISYKTTMLNWFLFDNFVQLDVFVSLANIVLEQEVFPEYLQDNASAFHFYNDINNWLTDKKSYEKIRAILKQTKERLTGDNFVTADYMFTVINEK